MDRLGRDTVNWTAEKNSQRADEETEHASYHSSRPDQGLRRLVACRVNAHVLHSSVHSSAQGYTQRCICTTAIMSLVFGRKHMHMSFLSRV